MQSVAKALRKLIIVLVLVLGAWVVIANWSFVFSKTVRGEIMEVERVTQPQAFVGTKVTAEQMFSTAILVRAESGEIYSASSEDRQWAVIKKGMCVETRLYPYPPWDLDKADTYFNARLVKVLNDCKRAGSELGPLTQPPMSPSASPTVVLTPAPTAASGTPAN